MIPRIFIGYDRRQPLAYNVLQHSIVRHASKPVSITPLIHDQLPIRRRGLTDFTFTRYLPPWLCGYEGIAVFMDADMVVTGDIIELFDWLDANRSGHVPVHVMQGQDRFEWASVMAFNCAACKVLTPEYVDDTKNQPQTFDWVTDEQSIGTLPPEWNAIVGYGDVQPGAKLLHYTQGIPCWYETRNHPEEDAVWDDERRAMVVTPTWLQLMGRSVHRIPVVEKIIQRYIVE